jgi:hypothetical protein
MPKGERASARSKRTAPPPNFKKSFSIGMIFQISISLCSKKGRGVVFSKSISQKDFEKDLQKNLQKQNMWCKRGPKC